MWQKAALFIIQFPCSIHLQFESLGVNLAELGIAFFQTINVFYPYPNVESYMVYTMYKWDIWCRIILTQFFFLCDENRKFVNEKWINCLYAIWTENKFPQPYWCQYLFTKFRNSQMESYSCIVLCTYIPGYHSHSIFHVIDKSIYKYHASQLYVVMCCKPIHICWLRKNLDFVLTL